MIIEVAVLFGLLWEHLGLSIQSIPLVLLLISPILILFHWKNLRKRFKENQISKSNRIMLFFLTGPAIYLSLSLLISTYYPLVRILKFGDTKEIQSRWMQESVSAKGFEQWREDSVKKMKSDIILYSIILASLCLLYGCRYSSACNRSFKGKKNEMDLKD